jgi:predicted lipoprotein with Yx(FWY)xxD motif
MRHALRLLLPVLSASLLLAACGGGKSSSSGTSGGASSSGGSSASVNTASNSKLGQTVLVNGQGLTLYHLTAETGGKFICTGSCESLWHPLTVAPGSKPSGGAGSLSLVKRPDGASQVAYKGMPLYTFAQDKSPGEANGQGFKDVGTWTAIMVSQGSASGAGGSAPAQSGGSGSGGSGGSGSGGSGY